MTERFSTLEFTPAFLNSLFRMRPTVGELEAVIDLLAELDDDPRATELHVHEVVGEAPGLLAAEGRGGVRMLFLRPRPDAVRLLVCARERED